MGDSVCLEIGFFMVFGKENLEGIWRIFVKFRIFSKTVAVFCFIGVHMMCQEFVFRNIAVLYLDLIF